LFFIIVRLHDLTNLWIIGVLHNHSVLLFTADGKTVHPRIL